MARVLLVLFALLALGLTAGPGFGQEHPPRVNPLTGKPYGPKALAEYEAAIKQQKAEEEAARAASEEAEQRWQEARARNAEQIRAFDEAIEDWQEDNPAPAGTRESLVATSYDNDTALGEHAEITYYNNWDVPTHKVQFGPDGKPTGPVTQTQQGKAWETIGPRIPPGGGVEISYGEDFDGNEIITEAHIFDAGGKSFQTYAFNFDGIPWRGETRDPETGLRNGGFLDDRFKPPERTVGGPLPVPPTVRLITGVCEPCRTLASEHNDLANEINTIIAEMASLSREHMHAYPPAQKPIRMRYEVLEKRLAELMAQFESLRARLLDCERQCRPPDQTPAGDGPSLARPAFQAVPDLAPPASFCSETERVGWLNTVYNPAVAAALANASTAQDHQARLNALFTEHMRANSPWWGQVRAERDAFEPVAAETIVRAEGLRGMYPAILAVPIIACPDQPRVATGAAPVVEPAGTVGETPTTVVSTGTPGEPPCPPKEGRQPITVGPNSKVGSGARLRAKVGGMALGALAGALGGGGGGGGGGGSDGPDLWTCKIKESEYTVFDDPATGVSLRVGAKRAKGGKVVIFSEIARSPDKGTFQTAFLENPMTGETQAPGDVGPCDLWGEWKLTVSWTKTTYVDGQMVSQEHGGWQKTGLFSIPGVLSKVDAPDGLWKRMGFSNASNGAREIGMIYDVPPGGGPLTFVIHVTRPRGDPVTTVPFVLTMTEGPGGFAFTKAEDPPCPPAPSDAPPESIMDDVDGGPPVLTGGTGIADATRGPSTVANPGPATPAGAQPTQSAAYGTPENPYRVGLLSEVVPFPDQYKGAWGRAVESLDDLRCHGPVVWGAYRDGLLRRLEADFDALNGYAGAGPTDFIVNQGLDDLRGFLGGQLTTVRAMTPPGASGAPSPGTAPAGATCPDGPPESILDDVEDVPPLLTGGTGVGDVAPSTGSRPPETARPTVPSDGPPESVLDDIDEGPPLLTGGTGIAVSPGVAAPAVSPPTSVPAYPSEREVEFHVYDPIQLGAGLEKIRAADLEARKALEAARCEGPKAWGDRRTRYIKSLRDRADLFQQLQPEGSKREVLQGMINSELVRLSDEIREVEALPLPPEPSACPAGENTDTDSILDSIEEVFVPA